MAFEHPQGSFVHAASYASLLLQVTEHLFPGQKIFSLSEDQRRILDNETTNLLVRARWKADSRAFAEQFATPLANVEMVPAGTVLGAEVPKPKEPERPGGYV